MKSKVVLFGPFFSQEVDREEREMRLPMKGTLHPEKSFDIEMLKNAWPTRIFHIGTLQCTGSSDSRNAYRYSVSHGPSSRGPVNP